MIPTLTVGIPVKNEENTIVNMLQSVVKAVKCLPKSVNYETIVCLNGNTDNTEKVIKENRDLCKQLNLTTVHSSIGKIPAEKKIASVRELSGFLLYCDADTDLDKYSIRELYDTMRKDTTLRVVCAKVLPKFPTRMNNFLKIMKSYYKMRYLLPERGCFHGRMFMMRDDKDILSNYYFKKTLTKIPKKLAKDLYLDKGPISDDIILSAAIVHKYGQNAIKRVHSAKVYFYPPDNLYDFYLGVRRYTIEIERTNLLFPEYEKINDSEQFARPIKISKPTLFKRDKHLAELLMELEHFLGKVVKDYEIDKNKRDLWEPVTSSKGYVK